MASRVILAVLAVVLLVWLGAETRSRSLEESAGIGFRLPGRVSAAELRWIDHRLERAESLSLDTSALYKRGLYNNIQGHPIVARRIAERLVDREPDNADAWVLLLNATRDSDPARSRQAYRQILRLNPLAQRESRGRARQ